MSKKKQQQEEKPHPLDGCVLHEMAKRGESFKYEYPDKGLPKVLVKSEPAQHAIHNLMKKDK